MKAIQLTEALYAYIAGHCRPASPVLAELAAETKALPHAVMQIGPDQGALMHLLAKLIGAKRILEVGCFTGYSAICMAAALPEGGRLITLDVNPETAAIAKRYFQRAGLAGKIDLRLGPALSSLPEIQAELGAGSFDLMFIDADKEHVQDYFDWGLKLVRSGGLILVDNVLWNGAVIDPNDKKSDTVAIKRFNDAAFKDERVDPVLINVADGIFACRKR